MQIIFIGLALATLLPYVSSALALFAGMVVALTLGNPFAAQSKKLTPLLLQAAIVGLGAGMDLKVVGRVGLHGILYTVIGIAFTLLLGTALGKWLKIERETSLLLSVGTAICGGSAIAAVAPVIKAKSESVSVSLATVFFLNASALLIFPWVGHQLGLTEIQFGLWSALAVHDTSSVVGTALQYGPQALEIATTVKLARALWIIPVTFAIGALWTHAPVDGPVQKPKRPWFILGFLAMAALVTWVPELHDAGVVLASVAKRLMVLTLFLIGSGLTRATLKNVGMRPLLQGFMLWVVVSSVTLSAIYLGWISL